MTKTRRTRNPIPPEKRAEWEALGYVTIDAAAGLLGVARSTLYSTIAAGRFPGGMFAWEVRGKKRRLAGYVKTPATLWVHQAAISKVVEERRQRDEARTRARLARRARPSALELASAPR